MDTIAFLDTETTGLHEHRMPWEIGLITRTPGRRLHDPEADTEWHWFIDPADLRWPERDQDTLDIGRFWDRHPHGEYLAAGGDPDCAPRHPRVTRLADALPVVARLTDNQTRIAGSNPAFDMQTLGGPMHAAGLRPGWHYHPDDIPNMIRGWLLGRRRPLPERGRSDDYCLAIGVDPAAYDRHTALGDCRLFRDAYDVIYAGAPT